MDSEELIFNCPCCSATLGLDDVGDLYAITDTREGNKGIGSIRVHEASGNDWKQRQYIEREPKKYQPPISMIAGVAGKQPEARVTDKSATIEADPELLQASDKDWNEKNIKPNE